MFKSTIFLTMLLLHECDIDIDNQVTIMSTVYLPLTIDLWKKQFDLKYPCKFFIT